MKLCVCVCVRVCVAVAKKRKKELSRNMYVVEEVYVEIESQIG